MHNTLVSEVPILLENWGRWARQRGLRLNFPGRSPYMIERGSSVPSPMISDECACWVDQCVAQVTPARARDALVLRFVVGATQQRACRELRCHPATFESLVEAGLHQVGEALLD